MVLKSCQYRAHGHGSFAKGQFGLELEGSLGLVVHRLGVVLVHAGEEFLPDLYLAFPKIQKLVVTGHWLYCNASVSEGTK